MRYREFCESTDKLELPDIEVNDTVLVGKFKNRKAVIKGFTTDKNNQPVLKTDKGDQKLFKPRIAKLMDGITEQTEVAMFSPDLKLYHGTVRRLWLGVRRTGSLYLTDDRDYAVDYADDVNEEKGDERIIVVFKMADLMKLPNVTFEPDWTWVETVNWQQKEAGEKITIPTWQESLQTINRFSIAGFKHKFKSLGQITPL
jgi:hypothetical protein